MPLQLKHTLPNGITLPEMYVVVREVKVSPEDSRAELAVAAYFNKDAKEKAATPVVGFSAVVGNRTVTETQEAEDGKEAKEVEVEYNDYDTFFGKSSNVVASAYEFLQTRTFEGIDFSKAKLVD